MPPAAPSRPDAGKILLVVVGSGMGWGHGGADQYGSDQGGEGQR